METSIGVSNGLLKILFACGIIAALLYATGDIVGIILKPGYNFIAQSVSELTSPGVITRPFVLSINVVADILLVAFAVGIWSSAAGNWALRILAVLIAGNAVFALLGLAFFPMHPEEAATNQMNRLNIILMAISMFCFVFAILFGIPANHNWLRWVSLGIIVFFLLATIFGLVVGRPRGATVGLQERSMIYIYVAWLIMQAMVLLNSIDVNK